MGIASGKLENDPFRKDICVNGALKHKGEIVAIGIPLKSKLNL